MSTAENWYMSSELSMAAYATLKLGMEDDDYVDALTHKDCGMTQAQAKAFAENWRVIDQYTAPSTWGLTGSGFSATVFERLDAEGKPTGDYVFAVRGTEPKNMNDLHTDVLGIGYEGFALRQAIDMYNYVQSLKADKNASYDALYLKVDLAASATLALAPAAYSIARLALESQGYWVEGNIAYKLEIGKSTDVLKGTGLEEGREAQLGGSYDVVGHSLGGHLAMMLGRMDPNVLSVTTFNPPFFDPGVSRRRTEEFFSQLGKLDSRVLNSFKSSQNFIIENDMVQKFGALRPGVEQIIFSEGSHSIINITDALAVYALFAKIDPWLELDMITGILEASSNAKTKTLEGAVSDLGKLFNTETNSKDLYANIGALQKAIDYELQGMTGMIAPSGVYLGALASYDFNAFLSLYYLLPFTVIGLYGALISIHKDDLYKSWEADMALTLEQRAAGEGNYSDQYLKDRADMLMRKMDHDIADTLYDRQGAPNYSIPGHDTIYKDMASGIGLAAQSFQLNHVVFGTEGNEKLEGKSNMKNRIYGGAGNDSPVYRKSVTCGLNSFVTTSHRLAADGAVSTGIGSGTRRKAVSGIKLN